MFNQNFFIFIFGVPDVFIYPPIWFCFQSGSAMKITSVTFFYSQKVLWFCFHQWKVCIEAKELQLCLVEFDKVHNIGLFLDVK